MPCPTGKTQYQSRAVAKRCSRRIKACGKGLRELEKYPRTLRPYKCEHCEMWHLSSKMR